MWSQDEKGEQDELQHTVDHVGLQIQHLQLNEEEVLGDERQIQDDLYTCEDTERDGSGDDDNRLVNTQSDLLGWTEQEVLELGSIQDEEDHGESDSNDLDYQEHHNALGSEPLHVVKQGCFQGGLSQKDTDVDEVAVTSEESVDKALNDNQVDDRLGDELEHFQTVILLE